MTDPRAEGPQSLYPALPPRDDVPRGSDVGEADEFGNPTDAGSIENGWVVYSASAGSSTQPMLVGPFRVLAEAEREADDMRSNIDPILVGTIFVVPLWRPYAGVGVTLRATEAEEERYTQIMAMDPEDRSPEQERFIEKVAEMLWAETTVEGTDGYDEV